MERLLLMTRLHFCIRLIKKVSYEALYTNATIAFAWFFQHMPNDQWDLDWVFERQIVELGIGGNSRKVVLTAGKMALFDVLDAATGEYLDSFDVGLQNIVTAIDPHTGNKTINPRAIPNAEDSNLYAPWLMLGEIGPRLQSILQQRCFSLKFA